MYGFIRPRFTTWAYDENNGLILMKVPEQINLQTDPIAKRHPPSLSTLDKPDQPPRTAPALPSLPTELLYTIYQYLPPVDRVCLALTCRRLCASVLASPRLTPESREELPDDTHFLARYGHPYGLPSHFPPDRYQLNPRLAHGWFDKKTWRYCWKCHKILPRDKEWWWNTCNRNGVKRLQGRKSPRWCPKIGVPRDEWARWSKRRKLEWIVKVWCEADWEDTSVMSCDLCRDQVYDNVERLHLELAQLHQPTANSRSNKNLNVSNFIGMKHPIECPSCLETGLTCGGRPTKRVWFKKVFWSIVGCVLEWIACGLWCVAQSAVALVSITWEGIEWVAQEVVDRLPCGGSRPPGLTWFH